MKLLVGLGNPGAKYELTRHNVGFIIVDQLMDKFGFDAPRDKFSGELSRGRLLGDETLLLKPQTFMNLSGKSVAACMTFFKIDISDVLVIHDDIDMDFAKLRFKEGGGHGGHNGIRSIIAEAGSSEFCRLKVGVGRPEGKMDVSSWVLNRFSNEELQVFDDRFLSDFEDRLGKFFDR